MIVWDGQVLDSGPMGIVAGTPRLAEALQFVHFVARPESMARISQYIAYSPVRRSADALVSTHLETGVEMRAAHAQYAGAHPTCLAKRLGVVERQRR